MIDAQRFRVNAANVVYETIDDEGVIVNMSSGIYYSVAGPGAEIWALIDGGTPTPLIVRALEGRYNAPREDLEAGLAHFIAELQAEGLIVPHEDQQGAHTDSPPPPAAHEAYRPRFEAPVLERYSDMEDLLLLDPIHEDAAQ